MRRLLAACFLVELACAVWVGQRPVRPGETGTAPKQEKIAPDTLFTCTTFLTLPHKLKELTKALESLHKNAMHPRIGRYIIINEYDPNNDARPILHMLREKFRRFEFIQKTEEQRGQAKSLNMAIDILEAGNYKYWMKWEESWEVDHHFLPTAYHIMDNSQIGRIGLTNDKDDETFLDKEDRGNHIVWSLPSNANLSLYQFEDRMEYERSCSEYEWPGWSLQPSFERASSIIGANFRFNEDPSSWPWPFEFEFSSKWTLNNHGEAAKTGVLKTCPVSRVGGHTSTYEEELPWSYRVDKKPKNKKEKKEKKGGKFA